MKMKVKFKGNTEPCIQYEVKQPVPQWSFDEVFDKYMLCLEIESLGYVPEVLLEETNHPDNINAIDVSVYLAIN